jgi:hypothetical protein
MISFITLICTDGQQLNKKYDHNDKNNGEDMGISSSHY